MFAGLLARLAVGTGLSPRVLKILGFVAIVALAVLAWVLWLHLHDSNLVATDRLKSNLEVTRKNADAAETAADERVADQAAVATQEKEMHDAIHSVPDSAPDAARVRLGCERLRRAGQDIAGLPACSGPQGGH